MEILDNLAVTFALNALWQIPAVVVAAFLGDRLLGRSPAMLHHSLWAMALTYCLFFPLGTLATGGRSPRPPETKSAIPLRDTAAEEPLWLEWMFRPRPEIALPRDLKLVLLSWVGAGSLVALARLAAAARRTRSLARSARAVELPATVAAAAERWRRIFDLGPIEILVSTDITGPVTLGWRRPLILVPPAFLTSTPETEIDAALGHEMAHVHHRDYPAQLAFEILAVPLAFHPVLRFLRHRLALTREMACDEAVVKAGIDARAYARSLLALAKAMAAPSPPTHTLGVFDADTLEARMKRMLSRRPRPGTLSIGLRCVAVTLVLGIFSNVAPIFAIVGGTAAGSGGQALVGTWTGWFEAKPGQRVKAIDLTVREAGERPEVAVTLYRAKYRDGKAEAVPMEARVVSSRLEGDKLVLRTRAENYRVREDGPAEKVEIEWTVELTGKDTAALQVGWHSKFSPAKERGEDVPPPPPPLPLQRVR